MNLGQSNLQTNCQGCHQPKSFEDYNMGLNFCEACRDVWKYCKKCRKYQHRFIGTSCAKCYWNQESDKLTKKMLTNKQ